MPTINHVLRASVPALACLTSFLNSPLAAEAEADPDHRRSVLEEVIVTATKRPTLLMDVPFSLHVIDGEEIERRVIRTFRDYLALAPGVSFSDVGMADVKINIRGVSTDLWNEVRSATAIYLDETPVTQPGATFIAQSPANPNLVDIARIEVLRGPQGALYGAGSMGGAVRIVTNKADPSRLRSEVDAVLSSTEHGGVNYEVDGVVNLPITNTAALRAVGYYRNADGFIDNVGTHEPDVNTEETMGARLAGTASLTDSVQLLATVAHQSQRNAGLHYSNVALDRYQQETLLPESYEDEWTLANAELTFTIGAAELTSITSYLDRGWREINDVSGFMAFFDAVGVVKADHWQHVRELTEELRLASRSEQRLQWLAGGFYSQRDQVWDNEFPAPGFDAATGGLASEFGLADNLNMGHATFDHDSAALFAEISYALTPRWKAILGGRLFRTEETSDFHGVGLLSGGVSQARRSIDEDGFTSKVSLAFDASDRVQLYATAAQGFRPGGPNFAPVPQEICAESLASIGLAEAPESYDSDSLWNYEIGGRYRSDGGRLALSGAAYHIDWSDVQLIAFLSCGSGFVANAGEARSNGLELEVFMRVLDSLDFDFNVALIDAALTSDVRALGVKAGDRLPGVPRETFNAMLTYWFARSAGGGGAYVRGEFQYIGDTEGIFVAEGAPRLTTPSHELANVRVGYEGADWSATLFIENVFDEYALINTLDDGGLHPAGDWYTLKRPRTVGLNIQRRFE